MRMHQAYLATLLPASGATSLMGIALCPIRSPEFQAITIADVGPASPSSDCTGLPPDRVTL